jgi:hypothetical protein
MKAWRLRSSIRTTERALLTLPPTRVLKDEEQETTAMGYSCVLRHRRDLRARLHKFGSHGLAAFCALSLALVRAVCFLLLVARGLGYNCAFSNWGFSLV